MNLGLFYYKGMYDDLSDEKLLKLLEEDKENNTIYVYVDKSTKPLAFGKWAVNVKLASKLLGKKVFIK